MRVSTWTRLAITLLAGCSFEPPALQPSGDGGPPGQTDASIADAGIDATSDIIDAAPDAPPDAPPDKDGDGVPDDEDNCVEQPNMDQANCDGDELGDACDATTDGPDMDGDRVADACDNCPTVSNEGQESTDGDPVGDACDPRPTEGGDSIAYFDSFDTASATAPAGWTEAVGTGLTAGGWRVEGGELVQNIVEQTILYLAEPELPPDVLVETRFQALGASGMGNAIAASGVIVRYNNIVSGDAGVSCSLEQRIDLANPAVVRLRNLLNNEFVRADAPWRVDGQHVYTIVQSQHGVAPSAKLGCTVTPADAGREPVSPVTPLFDGPPIGTVALRVVNGQSAFEYVLVYGLGGPLPAQ